MSNQQTQNNSYSRETQQSMNPKRYQAIVIEAIEGIPVVEYAVAIANKVDASNIRFISKISQSRVCLYLSSKELVDHLLKEENKKATIREKELEIKPLVTKNIYELFSLMWIHAFQST